MPEPLLELRSLRKRFGALAVTDDVSMTVFPGEIHAVIGPNGAGKTTLVGQVAGSVRPDGGVVLIAGQDVTRWTPHRRARLGLGRTFQITAVVPSFSALENVALAAQSQAGSSAPFGWPARRDRALNAAALAALERAGLAARSQAIAGTLSHGERRQLELAVALAAHPRLLLLDEPLAGAGVEETERLVALLRTLRAEHGILLVEHDMGAVFALADRISVLVDGRLVVTGGADAIRAHPEVRSAYLGEDDLA